MDLKSYRKRPEKYGSMTVGGFTNHEAKSNISHNVLPQSTNRFYKTQQRFYEYSRPKCNLDKFVRCLLKRWSCRWNTAVCGFWKHFKVLYMSYFWTVLLYIVMYWNIVCPERKQLINIRSSRWRDRCQRRRRRSWRKVLKGQQTQRSLQETLWNLFLILYVQAVEPYENTVNLLATFARQTEPQEFQKSSFLYLEGLNLM